MTKWLEKVQVLTAAVIVTTTLAACNNVTSPTDHRLRVANIGLVSVNELVIRFPGSTTTFGTIPAGTTTAYQPVASGVCGYGAYDFVVESVLIRQTPVDFVGESPLAGLDFTYNVELVKDASGRSMIRLSAVNRDK